MLGIFLGTVNMILKSKTKHTPAVTQWEKVIPVVKL